MTGRRSSDKNAWKFIVRSSDIAEPPRDVIKAIPGVEFVEMATHHEAAFGCRGSFKTFEIRAPGYCAGGSYLGRYPR